jgi:hypothetical protein
MRSARTGTAHDVVQQTGEGWEVAEKLRPTRPDHHAAQNTACSADGANRPSQGKGRAHTPDTFKVLIVSK